MREMDVLQQETLGLRKKDTNVPVRYTELPVPIQVLSHAEYLKKKKPFSIMICYLCLTYYTRFFSARN